MDQVSDGYKQCVTIKSQEAFDKTWKKIPMLETGSQTK